MRGKCKLCLQEKELIKRSHLFPNFLYKGIEDEKKRMFVVSSDSFKTPKTVQSGAYEEYILCSECDNNTLSKLERYANNYFYSKPYWLDNSDFEQITNVHGIQVIRCKNIAYDKFKLFLESLIWRASISSHALFADFKLTATQEETLRYSICSCEPLDEKDFACMMFTHQNREEAKADLVFINSYKPEKISFYLNQFIYLFYINKADVNEGISEIVLSRRNEMGIPKLQTGDWLRLRDSVVNGIVNAVINRKAIE